ncbi:hypothetical protein [Pseudodesulfovibrio pelocollis]|uniref:hypothetical protein n=1 Tax=Pseudodesulfovibrio pelocollis TaxID=3051432 RepID=UPI00255AA7B3|nr:hypothetical protein [Pseudodesulfovibrio sp. SB368]
MAKSLQLYLTEVRACWLEARIVLDGEQYDLSTHCALSEPLKDLFRCLCDAHGLEGPPDMVADYRHLEFEWVGEGWLYYWALTPGPDGRLEVSVEFKGKREVGGTEYPVWNIRFATDWATLAGQIFAQSAKLLRRYGFAGYLDRWSKDFPAGQMMRLGHLLHDQSPECEDLARELAYLGETA